MLCALILHVFNSRLKFQYVVQEQIDNKCNSQGKVRRMNGSVYYGLVRACPGLALMEHSYDGQLDTTGCSSHWKWCFDASYSQHQRLFGSDMLLHGNGHTHDSHILHSYFY